MPTVSLIGSGKLSYNLYKALMSNRNFKVVEVFSRSNKNIKLFDKEIKFTKKIENLKEVDFYFLLSNDDSIQEVSQKIKTKNGMILHSSGTMGMEILSNHLNFGVFYPLQTFSFNKKIDFTNIPILIESNTRKNLEKLKELCYQLKVEFEEVDSKKRLQYHLAASFANNFTNHILSLTDEIINKFNLKKDFFIPITNETFKKFKNNKSKESQTGPAVRNDLKTLKKHEEILKKSNYLNLYKIITKSIRRNDL
tara:strand:+ start:5964 stop:6719 length:756 start_codon:yes stop_codon:yes gene_type:complete